MIVRITILGIVIATLGLFNSQPSRAFSQDRFNSNIQKIKKQVTELEQEIQFFMFNYIKRELFKTRHDLETRLTTGHVARLLQDHLRASILFFDIVSNPKYRNKHGYREAVFYLAKSLLKLNNFQTAFKFLMSLTKNPAGKFYNQALSELVIIGVKLKRFQDVDKLYAQLMRSVGHSGIPTRVHYSHAKSLYFRKKFVHAETIFRFINIKSPYYFQARYFLGVIQVQRKRPSTAIKEFKAIFKVQPNNINDQKISELTALSMGRLYYDWGAFEQALDHYRLVPRSSTLFEQALYEIALTYVRDNRFLKAYRVLDKLKVALPKSIFAPKAHILMGNLMLRLHEFKNATKVFDDIIKTYSKPKAKLEDLIKRQEDPVAYFNQLLGKHAKHFNADEWLPPLAKKWVNAEGEVAKAMTVVKELGVSRNQVDSSLNIITQLESALNAPDKLDVFPSLREGRAKALEMEAKFLLLKKKLVAMEAQIIAKLVTQQERKKFQQAKMNRIHLEKMFNALPRTKEGYLRRKRHVEDRVATIDRNASKLGVLISGLKAQLVAIQKYYYENQRERKWAAKQKRLFMHRSKREERSLTSLDLSLTRLRQYLAAEKLRLGLGGGDPGKVEREIRLKYRRALEEERRLSQLIRNRLGADKVSLIDEIDKARNRISRLESNLQDFYKRLGQVVDQKLVKFRQKIKLERARLNAYNRALSKHELISENLVGQVAYQNFQKVRRKFYDIILKADYGLIDITWKKRELNRKKYRSVTNKKRAQIKQLAKEFNEALKKTK